MQSIALHKNVYKLYAYTCTQECSDVYRTLHPLRGMRYVWVNIKLVYKSL